jgi:hypothetical protein
MKRHGLPRFVRRRRILRPFGLADPEIDCVKRRRADVNIGFISCGTPYGKCPDGKSPPIFIFVRRKMCNFYFIPP